jgi:hypothetical protein
MKLKKELLLITLAVASNILCGQESDLKRFPLQFTFVYPLGTNGTRSVHYVYGFSLNALMGATGGIQGCEVAGILNINKSKISGLQVAGIGNFTNGNVQGLQVGGLINLANDLNGAQVGGIFNRAGHAGGLQVAGILNYATSSEASIGGLANINTGKQKGIQIAGIYNQAKDLDGVQVGLINITDTVNNGVSIGLINIVRKGLYDEWSFSFADYQNLGISYKLGTRQLYTIYSAGMNLINEQLWVFGLGLGHLQEWNPKYSFQPEIIGYVYFPMAFGRRIRDTYIAAFKFGFVRNINERIALSIAPSIYLSEKSNRGIFDEYGYEHSPIKPLFDVTPANSNSKLGFGFGLSLGLNLK